MRLISIVMLLSATGLFSAPLFVHEPVLKDSAGGKWVEFEISENTDVEVSIVDMRDSGVVRHLAAGMLGANPPTPLAANSLHQVLGWDGKDDFGKTASHPESLCVRVRAGMTPVIAAFGAEDPYLFDWQINGIVRDDDGSVLIFGKEGNFVFLRRFDAAGNYLKTLYPPPAGLPADSVTLFGVNVVSGGGWAPRTTRVCPVSISNTFMNSVYTRIFPVGRPGEIVLVNGLDRQIMSGSGAMGPSAKLVTTPQPAGLTLSGPAYFTASHDPDALYLSGIFYADGSNNACDTGFWRDGQVFRVDRGTGTAVSWLRLDSVPVLAADRTARLVTYGGCEYVSAAIHGVAADDSGRVFVCDRLHKRINVYDTNAVLLGGVPCVSPDVVAVSRRTGAIYVVTSGYEFKTLYRYDGWRSGAAASYSLRMDSFFEGFNRGGTPSIALTESGSATAVWVGMGRWGVRIYSDDGATLSLVKNFTPKQTPGPCLFERLAVDRKTDKLYWLTLAFSSSSSLQSIADWTNPVVDNTAITGPNRVMADDITVAPNGLLYVEKHACNEPYQPGEFMIPVRRYTQERIPADYANTGDNRPTGFIHYEGSNHRGLAVSWQGKVAVYNEEEYLLVLPDTGWADSSIIDHEAHPAGSVAVHNLRRGDASGVKFDAAGNVYVGAWHQPPDWQITPGFGSDPFFLKCGSILKFAPGDTGGINNPEHDYTHCRTVTGASKIYSQPFGPFAADGCTCRNPRFDVDPYGRLYIPCGPTAQVAVADNAGNTIATFGQYGNTDDREGIPMAWPTSTAASEDYIYVGDAVNARIARVGMNYALDNLPGITGNGAVARVGAATRAAPTLTACPNPFNPTVILTLSGIRARDASIKVFDLSGGLVADLSGSMVNGRAAWNASGSASGVYVAVAQKGALRAVRKIIYSR